MAAPANASNGVFVVVPPNNTGIVQPQGTPGTVLQPPSILQYGDQQVGSMHPTNQPQPVLKQENPGKAERFLKAEIKTLAVSVFITLDSFHGDANWYSKEGVTLVQW